MLTFIGGIVVFVLCVRGVVAFAEDFKRKTQK